MMSAPPASTEVQTCSHPLAAELFTPAACAFLAALHREFGGRRVDLLVARTERDQALAAGATLAFADAPDGDWRVPPIPAAFASRRVELVTSVGTAAMRNALRSGAAVVVADLEDSTSPTWDNVVTGHRNVRDAVRGLVPGDDAGAESTTADAVAIVLRPRGWHLDDANVRIRGKRISAGLLDVGLHLFHSARTAVDRGGRPHLYLPKLECAAEAKLWADVFTWAEDRLGLERGTIRATALIETVPAAFETDAILAALGDHALGLKAGGWDHVFSAAKRSMHEPGRILEDRTRLDPSAPFVAAAADLLVATCRRRGARAVGGTSVHVPRAGDAGQTAEAVERVQAEAAHEAAAGFDGIWVVHPDLVPVAQAAFETADEASAPKLVPVPDPGSDPDRARLASALTDVGPRVGTVTDAAVRSNIDVGIRYLAAWLGGVGAIVVDGQVVDTAAAEVCRMQLASWVRHGAVTVEGNPVDARRVRRDVAHHVDLLVFTVLGDTRKRHLRAAELFADSVLEDPVAEFLTLAAYEQLGRPYDAAPRSLEAAS
jgi:malate synthase